MSKKVVFISYDILNPTGISKTDRFSEITKDLLDSFIDAGVGIVQMPNIEDTDSKINVAKCKKIAYSIVKQIKSYLNYDYHVLAILDLNLNGSKKSYFTQEIEREMEKRRFQVPIIGIKMNSLIDSMKRIQMLIKYCDF